MGATTDTTWFDEPLRFAIEAHAGQARKGTEIPYIVHPLAVALHLQRHGLPRDVIVAGLLHDVVEDSGVPIEEIRRRFGAPVAEAVAAVSETKSEGGQKRPWRLRKEEQLAHLDQAGDGTIALKAADSLHNTRSVIDDLRRHGESVWQRFNAGPVEQTWWYRAVAERVRQRLGDHPLAKELCAAVDELTGLLP